MSCRSAPPLMAGMIELAVRRVLGDPRQLDRPIQGVHPPGADVSALGHLLPQVDSAVDRCFCHGSVYATPACGTT